MIHKKSGNNNPINDGINDDLEDDRAAEHPGAIPQPESLVAASHTQRFEAR